MPVLNLRRLRDKTESTKKFAGKTRECRHCVYELGYRLKPPKFTFRRNLHICIAAAYDCANNTYRSIMILYACSELDFYISLHAQDFY